MAAVFVLALLGVAAILFCFARVPVDGVSGNLAPAASGGGIYNSSAEGGWSTGRWAADSDP